MIPSPLRRAIHSLYTHSVQKKLRSSSDKVTPLNNNNNTN